MLWTLWQQQFSAELCLTFHHSRLHLPCCDVLFFNNTSHTLPVCISMPYVSRPLPPTTMESSWKRNVELRRESAENGRGSIDSPSNWNRAPSSDGIRRVGTPFRLICRFEKRKNEIHKALRGMIMTLEVHSICLIDILIHHNGQYINKLRKTCKDHACVLL